MIDHFGPEIHPLPDGRTRLHGTAASLCRWLDERLLRMALEGGAIECRFPLTIERGTLERAGFFDAFPEGATAVGESAGASRYLLCPAVCYHVYPWMANTQFDVPLTVTAAHACFREADRKAAGHMRWWEFTMREVVFVGSEGWVSARRDHWAAHIAALAAEMGLRATLSPASDPFFGAAARGQRLMQQIKGLKIELRAEAAGQTAAVASFNRHETFFSTRFGLMLEDGRPAHTGCVAFGLERWAAAIIDQLGAERAARLLTT